MKSTNLLLAIAFLVPATFFHSQASAAEQEIEEKFAEVLAAPGGLALAKKVVEAISNNRDLAHPQFRACMDPEEAAIVTGNRGPQTSSNCIYTLIIQLNRP